MAEKSQTPIVPPHESHGNSVAAWTAVTIMMVGFLVLVVAWVKTDIPLYIVGAVVIAVGGIVGRVLSAMGFGASHKPGS